MPVDILAHIIGRHPSAAVKTLRPANALLHAVECYCWYTHLHNKSIWAALDGQPALVFLLNTSAIRFTGQHEQEITNGFFCNGVLENTYLEELGAGARLLVVKFTADGRAYLKPLLPVAVTPLTPLPAFFGKLLTALRQTSCEPQQAALLDTFLARKLPFDITGNYILQTAVALIRQHRGNIAVSDLCTRLKVNYKWLERNFRISTGVTPKNYINNIRFLHAWLDVQASAQPLTGIALDNGYYDQNHFIKAYRRYTGGKPSAGRITNYRFAGR